MYFKIDIRVHVYFNNSSACEKKKKGIERLEEQLMKLEVSATDKVSLYSFSV